VKVKKRIGAILVEVGMITQEDLNKCLEIQKTSSMKLGEILLAENLATREQISAILEYQYGVQFIDLNEIEIDLEAIKTISEQIARKHTVIPIAFSRGDLVVVMADPVDIIARDDIRLITGKNLEIVMSFESDILRFIDKYYDTALEAIDSLYEEEAAIEMDPLVMGADTGDVTNSPVVKLVNSVIQRAVKSRASDIHIEPFEEEVRIRFRIDGALREEMKPPKNSYQAIVARIKIMGGMDISEKRVPQDGRVETVIDGREIDLRISILPTVYGEKIVIRLLDRSSISMTKEKIGFSPQNIKLFDRIIKAPEGMILLTGPTGSGKTTTLYAALRELNKITSNIITAEDPVEYRLNGVNQVHINTKAGLTFASTLRAILRQDPDIIMVGEIRDAETAEIAVRAAITGHLVLSTLHTNDTVSTITRLVDMGIEAFLVATSVVGVISQRLVKRICPKCKREIPCTEEDMRNLKISKPVKLYKGAGCRDCGNIGYKGRIGVHEILVMDKNVKAMITKGESASMIRSAAESAGMISLADSCRRLVVEGVTTIEEMLRVAYSIDD
jgi:type IV pilus assembly protein PilB